MEVHYNEGLANHVDPEPRGTIREDIDEASVGVSLGQPLSRESYLSRAPTPLTQRKAMQIGAISRAPVWPGVVEDPGMGRSSLYGNREISCSSGGASLVAGPRREGEEP